jgi:hydroxymethylpyrimidine/phosphomethylpyrimidine kinase
MSRPVPTPPRLLTIAGSDSGGGAGIQADLKTFAAHGAYGMTVVTAVTVQNTRQVKAVWPVPADIIAGQIDAVFEDIGVDVVKIGMLGTVAVIETVAERLRSWRSQGQAPAVVLDPVMVAKSGDLLLADDAVEALLNVLVPLSSLVTPNLPEASRLTGLPTVSEEDRRLVAEKLASLGPAVLVKGGHGEGEELVDLLLSEGTFHRFSGRRLATTSTHGTGCTLASAIAARLGSREALVPAVRSAIGYLRGAMAAAFPLGAGHGPVNHFYRLQGK